MAFKKAIRRVETMDSRARLSFTEKQFYHNDKIGRFPKEYRPADYL
jgi:hypothetical protein